MSNDLYQCPNCGAYVTSGGSTCPRCDYPLEPDAAARARADLPTDIIDPVVAVGDNIADTVANGIAGAEDRVDEEPVIDAPAAGEVVEEVITDEAVDFLDEANAATLRLPGHEDVPFALPQANGAEPENAPVLEDTAELPPAELPPAEMPEAEIALEAQEAESPAEPVEDEILAEPKLDPEAATGPGDILPPPAEEKVVIRRPTALTPQPVAVQFPPESITTVSGSTPRHAPPTPEPTLPPAPFTPPPPVLIQPPQPSYQAYSAAAMQSAGIAYVQQRVQAYLRGGYHIVTHAPHEATLARGKGLSVGGWLLALITVIGFLWYMLILAVSGFKPDRAYLVLETDGRVYEDGPGAAHVRDARSRAGRRWALFGLLLVVICGILALTLGAVALVTLSQERYQAALRAAYPAVSLFEERLSDAPASPDDVDIAKTASTVFAVVGGIAVIGLWAGATLFVIGTVQASAYRVQVPPLPAYG